MNDTSGRVRLSRKLSQSVILTSLEKRENQTASFLLGRCHGNLVMSANPGRVSEEQGGVPTGDVRDTKTSRMWLHGPENQEAETET